MTFCFKLLTIGLLLIALVSPWWALSGEKATISTTTNTFVVPPQIITLTTSSNAIGGEISVVPEDVTMVLTILSLLVALTCFLLFLSLLIMKRLRKITMILSLLSIVILVLSLVVFVYAFSQLTQVGVGSFMGSGNLDVAIPGEAEPSTVSCSWGPGIGFYLLIPSLILLIITLFIKRIEGKFIRKE
jgi:glucan phosphoethanolaminetransferase (alkaline phosphatase superfamily)